MSEQRSRRRKSERRSGPTPIVVDEDVPQRIVGILLAAGFAVHEVREVLTPGASDDAVADYAHSIRGIVLTCNPSHFKKLFNKRMAPGSRNAGSLVLMGIQSFATERLEE